MMTFDGFTRSTLTGVTPITLRLDKRGRLPLRASSRNQKAFKPSADTAVVTNVSSEETLS